MMSQMTFPIDEHDFAREAGNLYSHTRGLAFEDARLGLKYMLLRLSLLGLTQEDQKRLRKLAQLVFADPDDAEEVEREVDQIRNHKDTSPLAVAIANIVAIAPEKKLALLGAIFGAYAGLGTRGRNTIGGIHGAVAGGRRASHQQISSAASRDEAVSRSGVDPRTANRKRHELAVGLKIDATLFGLQKNF